MFRPERQKLLNLKFKGKGNQQIKNNLTEFIKKCATYRNTITGTGTVRYLGSLYLNVYLYLLGKAATDELKISSLGLKDNFKVIGTVGTGTVFNYIPVPYGTEI